MPGRLVVAALGGALYLVSVAPAGAQSGTPVGSCPATCSTNCYLQNNITCTNGQGVILNSGANLDMNGHTITCTSAACANAAVTINASGSKVYDSLNTPGFEPVITGPFEYGVDCNNQTSSEVTGIAIRNIGHTYTGGQGVYECAKVHGNVLIGNGNYNFGGNAITISAGTAHTDFVRDNYIDNWTAGVKFIQTTKNVTVDHNVITIRTYPSSSAAGIILLNSTGSGYDISDNVIMGDATAGYPIFISGSGPPTSVFDHNFCDPSLGTACSNCITAGYCEDPLAPFSMP